MTQLSVQQAIEAAMNCHRAQDPAGAEAFCRQVLANQPENAQALHLLGLICSDRGEHEKALNWMERAVEADPLAAEYRTNQGVVLERLGRTEEAVAAYRLALEISPDLTDARVNLANALSKLGRWDEAIEAYRAAADRRPQDAEIHNALGAALYGGGQIEPALAELATALELRPEFPEAYNNVGNALVSRGDLDLAIAAYRKAVAINPGLTDVQINLANALDRNGQRDQALAVHLQVAKARPDHAETQMSIGDGFYELGRWDEAADAYRRAVELLPQDFHPIACLGRALLAKPDLDGAIAAYRQVLELDPNSVEAANNLGVAFKEQGLMDEALDWCEKAMEIQPDSAAVHSNLVYLLSFHAGYDPPELARQQRLWNEKHARPLRHLIRPHGNDPAPDRRLKIGYVSPDFRQHVVGQNLLPLLSEHDHKEFKIHCYSSVLRPDPITEVLRSHADVWRNVAVHTDDELAEIIRADCVDVLVDLSLHMSHNRLLVFARKPAPVQVSYLGYCAGTGLEAMDYRLSDPYLDPPDSDLSIYSEQTIRLPETYWCYGSAGPTPEPAPPPCQTNGFVTFGCLNNFAKVSPGALDLWAEVLAGVPRSRLIVHSYPGSHLDAVRRRFAGGGVSPDRLEFLAKQPWSQYVQTWGRIDVALDPFPYGGGITTCDALWMGVPVVSLIGQTAVGRGGKSILSNVGLPELAARRPRQYVQTAATLAESPGRLAELRGTLRQRMLASPLMSARRFARNVEKAYRLMWRQWCVSRARSQ
ncbi:MAG: tetratricopeptide repeat protein [Tepidisphaeraceae bacterium]|jgi:predicted O-linked N-acetylglucosamine transferase (SPINDLY family)